MSMLIIYQCAENKYAVVSYRRPKWDSFEYASMPITVLSPKDVESCVFAMLGTDFEQTRSGVEQHVISRPVLTPKEERDLLTDARAVVITPKKVIGGFLDVIRFIPQTIRQRRLHKVLDKDPS